MDARIIEVIETDLTRRGNGETSDDPVRIVYEYWSKDGNKLAERDTAFRDLPCDLHHELREVRAARDRYIDKVTELEALVTSLRTELHRVMAEYSALKKSRRK